MRYAALAGAVGTGCALVVAPAALGYAGDAASDVHRAVGPCAAAVAFIALSPATRALHWLNLVSGAVLLVALAVVPHTGAAVAVGVVGGLLLLALTPFAPPVRPSMGGGWRSVADAGSAADEPAPR